MAKITTITNPLTGQPAQVDQLEHTAQQIDDAISRALPGGAIDIALQNKTDGERRNYARVGGAVGWYRICIGGTRDDRCRAIVSLTHLYSDTGASDLLLDVNTDADVKGLRCLAYGGKGSSSPIVTKARVVGLSDYKQAIDVYYNTASNGNRWVIGIVNLGNGTFSIQTPTFVAADDTLPDGETLIAPMEWVNPPMELNKEYRTTERYLGKPVYKKAVKINALPVSATANIYVAPENSDTGLIPVGVESVRAYDSSSDYYIEVLNGGTDFGIDEITLSRVKTEQYPLGRLRFTIVTTKDRSTYSAVAVVKYTKTTD